MFRHTVMWVSVLQAESNMATQKCVQTFNTHPWISVHTYMQAASTDERKSRYDLHLS